MIVWLCMLTSTTYMHTDILHLPVASTTRNITYIFRYLVEISRNLHLPLASWVGAHPTIFYAWKYTYVSILYTQLWDLLVNIYVRNQIYLHIDAYLKFVDMYLYVKYTWYTCVYIYIFNVFLQIHIYIYIIIIIYNNLYDQPMSPPRTPQPIPATQLASTSWVLRWRHLRTRRCLEEDVFTLVFPYWDVVVS